MPAHPPPAIHAPPPAHHARHHHRRPLHQRRHGRHYGYRGGFVFTRVTVVVTITRSHANDPQSPLTYRFAQKAPVAPNVTVSPAGDVLIDKLNTGVIFKYELVDLTGADFEFRQPDSEALYTSRGADKTGLKPWTDDKQFRFPQVSRTGMTLRFGYSNCPVIAGVDWSWGSYVLKLEDRSTHELSESDPKIKNGTGTGVIEDPDITRRHRIKLAPCR